MSTAVPVSALAEQVRGVTYGKGDASQSPLPGYLPVLRAGNITENGLTFDDLVFVPSERISQKQRIRQNDVVIAASSGSLNVVGKAARALTDYEGGFGAFCKVLRPGPDVDPAYFAHFFRTQHYRQKVSALAAGVNINNLRNEHLDRLQIPLPPLPEQRRIAEILDKADALRAKRRTALAQLDTLTQSIFLDMFGDPATNPKGWPMETLDALGDISTGKTPPTKNEGMFGGGVPFATPGDLDVSLESTQRTITSAGAAFTRVVRAGSALVGCIGNIGKMAKTPVATAFNQQINAVEWGDAINDDYGITALAFAVPQMFALASSTTVPILNKSSFSKVRIPVPPPGLQGEFASRISALRRLRLAYRASLSQIDALFASLQHRAFRGEL
jgi:type I restriction enzyme, S subunit